MRFLGKVSGLLAAALVAGCGDQAVAPTEYANPSFSVVAHGGPSANGNAILPPELFNGMATAAFHAREKVDGSVSGTLESLSQGQDLKQAHVELDCLVINGSEAILGGVITHLVVGPELPFPVCEGDRVWFRVRDNGEGAGESPDEFSDWYPDLCGTFTTTVCGAYPYEEFPGFVPDFMPIWAGNIQVKR